MARARARLRAQQPQSHLCTSARHQERSVLLVRRAKLTRCKRHRNCACSFAHCTHHRHIPHRRVVSFLRPLSHAVSTRSRILKSPRRGRLVCSHANGSCEVDRSIVTCQVGTPLTLHRRHSHWESARANLRLECHAERRARCAQEHCVELAARHPLQHDCLHISVLQVLSHRIVHQLKRLDPMSLRSQDTRHAARPLSAGVQHQHAFPSSYGPWYTP